MHSSRAESYTTQGIHAASQAAKGCTGHVHFSIKAGDLDILGRCRQKASCCMYVLQQNKLADHQLLGQNQIPSAEFRVKNIP